MLYLLFNKEIIVELLIHMVQSRIYHRPGLSALLGVAAHDAKLVARHALAQKCRMLVQGDRS